MTIRITCLNNDSVGMSGGMWGEHGVVYLVEKEGHRLLFDTGTSWEIAEHNLKKLEIDLKGVSHVVLSHGHYDHTGGLMAALEALDHPTVVADPLVFQPKFARNPKTGEMHEIGVRATQEQVARKAALLLIEAPCEILPGVHVTGRIPQETDFEPTPEHMYAETGAGVERDRLPDDRSLVLDTGSSLVLLCGCCHAGLVNTLAYVRRQFDQPLRAVIGGIHLVGARPERIEKTLAALHDEYQPAEMYFNHCTGLEATVALINLFGERVKPCLAGTVLEFKE